MGEKAMVLANFEKAMSTGIFLAALLTPAVAYADCTKIVDKHLEYYAGLKYHLELITNSDPGTKTIPYDVKIIDDRSQRYPLYTADVSFFYPNDNTKLIDLEFQDSYLQALCIIQTPDDLKWVVWKDADRVYFFDENEQPH